MGFSDDFIQILAENSSTISIIAIVRTIVDGYVSTTETTTAITAIVQALRSEDLAYLAGLGYTAEDLKAYVSATATINIGDEISYNSQRYLVNHIEKQKDAFLKILMKRKL